MTRTVAVNTDVVEFVRLGQNVSLDWRVTLANRATFNAAMAVAHRCNEFDPVEVPRTIGDLFDEAMRIDFGYEGSVVLYVALPFFPGQRMDSKWGGMGDKYTDEERQAHAQRVIDWGRSMKADEISTYQHPTEDSPVWNKPGDHPARIRLWWD